MVTQEESCQNIIGEIYPEVLLGLSGIESSCIYNRKISVKELLSPSEGALLDRLSLFGEEYCKLKRFIDETSNIQMKNGSLGFYMLAFVETLDACLQPYRNELIKLEKEEPSLSKLYGRMFHYSELLTGLNNLVTDIKSHNLHGVAILEKIHEHLCVSTRVLEIALKFVSRGVSKLLFAQLKSWLMYGEITDTRKEFFIMVKSSHENPFEDYVLSSELLPTFIRPILAEKILNVGQTVCFLRSGPKIDIQDHNPDITPISSIGLTGSKAQELSDGLAAALLAESWRQWGVVEKTVDAVATVATTQLHTVAMSHANLIQQLHMLKDLFLMGRGELFHEFLTQTDGDFHSFPDLNMILQNCGRRVYLNEDNLRPFRLEYLRKEGLFNIDYSVPWPLQLLFTPSVLSSYNHICRFLLRLKRIQLKMVNVWLRDKSKKKVLLGSKRRQLQQNLWFLVNNLQYYLQVDVLDSQFVELIDAVSSSKDFDEVRAAHSKFLSNLIIQSFLDTPELSSGVVNPVQQRMNTILKICEEYCSHAEISGENEMADEVVEALSEKFESCFECLFALLAAVKKHAGHPCNRPLSQLLLRLDFNYYFSQKARDTSSIAVQFL